MSVLPAGFDPRAEIVGLLTLVQIDAVSGTYGFMPGQEGRFTDANGFTWYGSQLIGAGDVDWSRDGTAPQGQLTLSYFQDPSAPDLIQQLRDSGDAETRGRPVRFYIQPLTDMAQFFAPTFAPLLIATKVAGPLTFEIEGDVIRRITLALEGPSALRRASRGLNYNVEDHNRLIGTTGNPSLEFAPSDARQEEKLFG